MHPWLAAHALNAFSTTSTMRWEVRTFPPHTAAVRDGERRDFSGILTVIANDTLDIDEKLGRGRRTFERHKTPRIQRYIQI